MTAVGMQIPARAGVGLRAPHCAGMRRQRPAVGFLEVHPENYMGAGGPAHEALEELRTFYPLSFHGVGLSLASCEAPDKAHLARLRALIERYRPGLVSEHLAWCAFEGRFFNDLLPLPLTEETLDLAAANIRQAQDALGRRILIENPSLYGLPAGSVIPETDFLAELAARTACGLLLDVNNVAVTSANLAGDPFAYIAAVPAEAVGEIHLAGHTVEERGAGRLRIDDHAHPAPPEVIELTRAFLARAGPRPVLFEWDSDLPPLAALVDQARIAQTLLDEAGSVSKTPPGSLCLPCVTSRPASPAP